MGLIRYLIFENPTTLWVLLVIAAVACGTIWRRTGSPGCRAAAVACVAASVLVGILAWAVETDRERLQRTLTTMNDAMADSHAEMFIERISPLYQSGTLGKAALADVVRRGLTHVRADADTPTIAFGSGDAVVTQACRFYPAPGSKMMLPPAAHRVVWEGVFAPDPDGEWRLRSATAISPRRMTPEQAAQYLPRKPKRQ